MRTLTMSESALAELAAAIKNSTSQATASPPPVPAPTGAPATPSWPSTGSNYPHSSPDPIPATTRRPTPAEIGQDYVIKPMAAGNFSPAAFRYVDQIAQRVVDMWDLAANMPSESLSASVEWVRTHNWTAGGGYIFDAYGSNPDAAPGDPNYKPKP